MSIMINLFCGITLSFEYLSSSSIWTSEYLSFEELIDTLLFIHENAMLISLLLQSVLRLFEVNISSSSLLSIFDKFFEAIKIY